jgi:hypothetical protein
VALLVHGIVRAGAVSADDLGDATDADLELITHSGTSAITTHAPDGEVLPSRTNLLRHTRVLETAAGVTTVLPMRFGTVVPDGATLVNDYLDPEEQALLAALDRLAGHVEVRVRGRFDEAALLQLVVAADPQVEALRGRPDMDARIRLGERVVEGIEAQRARHLELVVDALQPPATDVAPGRLTDRLEAFLVSFLVDRGRMPDFERALERLGEAVAPVVGVELIGPLPPFSFADIGAR